ncbi:MAG: nucleotide pyrophosphohydrolase [Candidatus Thorarchaeota archaeon]|nr:nucleotide pyrophosphohydrolase [Candidatus Thorarchaeota archaeon]
MGNESHSLEDLMALVREFVQERDWEGFQKPSSLAISAAIETGELLERFQWLTHEEIAEHLKNEDYRLSVEDEIADVMIYMIRLADTIGIEPSRAILRKLEKNKSKYPVEDWKGKIPDKVRNPR